MSATSPSPFVPLRCPLILASSSPRRAALLRDAGIPFTVMEPGVGEHPDPSHGPVEHAVDVALRKARDVASRVRRDAMVLGADTIVVVDGRVLGKPAAPGEARAMLRLLAGRTHEVVTGIALVRVPGGRSLTEASRTLVTVRTMSAAEIDAYVAGGEPMDKAGAYGIQGSIAAAVERIEGCYFNVVGLPLERVAHLIARAGGEDA